MAKIEEIKTEFVEFKVFASAKVFTLFEALHKDSIFEHIQKKPNDMKAYCDILFYGHKSACLLLEIKPKFDDVDYLLDRLDINSAISGVALMLGIALGDQKVDTKKK